MTYFPVFSRLTFCRQAAAASIFHRSISPAYSSCSFRIFHQSSAYSNIFLHESEAPGMCTLPVPAAVKSAKAFYLFLKFYCGRCCRYFVLSDSDNFCRFHPECTLQEEAYLDFSATAAPRFPFPRKIRCCILFPQRVWYTAHDVP